MISFIKSWFRFDADTLPATANAVAAFYGFPYIPIAGAGDEQANGHVRSAYFTTAGVADDDSSD